MIASPMRPLTVFYFGFSGVSKANACQNRNIPKRVKLEYQKGKLKVADKNTIAYSHYSSPESPLALE